MIENIEWSDVEVTGFHWANGGRDLIVDVRKPSDGCERSLTFRWAEALSMQLQFPAGRGGGPLSWVVKISRRTDEKMDVFFDFAADGHLRLICESVVESTTEVRATPQGP